MKVKILIPWDNKYKEKINDIKIKYPKIEFRILQRRPYSYIGNTIIDTQSFSTRIKGLLKKQVY